MDRQPTFEGGGPPYEVIGLVVDESARAGGHDHVRFVDTLDPDGTQTRWTAIDVIAAIRAGERFVLAPGESTSTSVLEPSVCPVCPVVTLRIEPAGAQHEVRRA